MVWIGVIVVSMYTYPDAFCVIQHSIDYIHIPTNCHPSTVRTITATNTVANQGSSSSIYFVNASVRTTATVIVIPVDRSFNDDDSVVFEGEDYDEVDDDDDNSIIYIYMVNNIQSCNECTYIYCSWM